MKCRFSVIIPVYNAEKTIRRCLDSLLNQPHEYVEILLINDGSPDHSGEICQRYAERNDCIRYFEQENGGVSTARNLGLDNATGEYVMFVDSDDYVSGHYFAVISEALREYDYDLIQFSRVTTDGTSSKEMVLGNYRNRNRADFLNRIIDAICRKTINPPWAKVYKRDILMRNDIRFPEGASIAEDRAFNIAYSTHIDSYRVSDQAIYCVCTENENSLSRKKHEDLEKQFKVAEYYMRKAIQGANISAAEKAQYDAALNFGTCRGIYKSAKDLHRDGVPFLKRMVTILRLSREINRKKMQYPKTRYCRLITIPVKWYLAPVIDLIAWKLVH